MYYSTSPGRTPWPGVWASKEKWQPREGWVLQPFLPPSPKNPSCLVGKNYIWANAGSTSEFTHLRSFRGFDLRLENELLVGTILHGATRRNPTGRGKVVVHDIVSEAPFRDRLKRLKELVKGHALFDLSLPRDPECPVSDSVKARWPRVGWLAKKIDAPVRVNKELVVSDTTLHLDYCNLY
jgi:hypothetical protein